MGAALGLVAVARVSLAALVAELMRSLAELVMEAMALTRLVRSAPVAVDSSLLSDATCDETSLVTLASSLVRLELMEATTDEECVDSELAWDRDDDRALVAELKLEARLDVREERSKLLAEVVVLWA